MKKEIKKDMLEKMLTAAFPMIMNELIKRVKEFPIETLVEVIYEEVPDNVTEEVIKFIEVLIERFNEASKIFEAKDEGDKK